MTLEEILLIPADLPTTNFFSEVTSSDVNCVFGIMILAEYSTGAPPWEIRHWIESPSFAPIRYPSITLSGVTSWLVLLYKYRRLVDATPTVAATSIASNSMFVVEVVSSFGGMIWVM